jgi:hypothetical protein
MKSTVTILLAFLTVAGAAQAMVVSAKVGPLLREAQQMIMAKNYKGATAKLNDAEAVKSNADDETVINQMRQAIATSSLDPTKPQCSSASMGVTDCNGHPAIRAQP